MVTGRTNGNIRIKYRARTGEILFCRDRRGWYYHNNTTCNDNNTIIIIIQPWSSRRNLFRPPCARKVRSDVRRSSGSATISELRRRSEKVSVRSERVPAESGVFFFFSYPFFLLFLRAESHFRARTTPSCPPVTYESFSFSKLPPCFRRVTKFERRVKHTTFKKFSKIILLLRSNRSAWVRFIVNVYGFANNIDGGRKKKNDFY